MSTSDSSQPQPQSSTRAQIALIWAQADRRVIGANGAMPWHLPEDLAHFRELTGTDTVVMGRRTWESLPTRFRPLPGRQNLVVTRDAGFSAEGAHSCGSVPAALDRADSATVWIIGGGQIYRETLPIADRLEITEIRRDFDGDTFAPEISTDEWTVTTGEWLTSASGIEYRFVSYLR